MIQEKFNLNWQTYSDHLRAMLHNMRKSNYLSDVTLVCDDEKQLKAHKIVLSASSAVFKSIIDNLPRDSSVIELKEIHHQELDEILQFIYLGVVNIDKERMDKFLSVARNLKIKEICDEETYNTLGDRKDSLKEEKVYEKEKTSKFDRNDNRVAKIVFSAKGTKIVYTEDTKNNVIEDTKSILEEEETKVILDPPEADTKVIAIQVDGNYACNVCEVKFHYQRDLIQHNKVYHANGMMYCCDQCDYRNKNKSKIREHRESEHEGIRYNCPSCDYKAKRPSHLRFHVEAIHEKIRYMCKQCDHEFTAKENLTRHVQAQHEKLKYSCSACKAQFVDKGILRRHILSQHEGIRYPCPQCDHMATSKAGSKEHIKRKHPVCDESIKIE